MSGGGGYEEEGHENHERWIVSYADFITLLFATFTALYAVAQQNTSKAEAFEQSIQQAMNQTIWEKIVQSAGSSQSTTSIPTLRESAALPKRSFIVAEERCIETAVEKKEREKFAGDATEDMEDILDPELEALVDVTQREEDLVVSLMSAGLFASGSAVLKSEAIELLKPVMEKLQEFERIEIKVEGHTDNMALSGGRHGNNWGLSAARATAVVTTLVDQYKVDPEVLSAVGLGEHHPIATNKTASGRAKNRRIDLVIRQLKPPVEEWEKSVRKRLSGHEVLGKDDPEKSERESKTEPSARRRDDAARKPAPAAERPRDRREAPAEAGGGGGGLGDHGSSGEHLHPPEPTEKPLRRGPPPKDEGAALPVGLLEEDEASDETD